MINLSDTKLRKNMSPKKKKSKKKKLKLKMIPDNIKTNDMKFIDLCCGIGGFHQALSKLDMECVLASDIDKDCRENYELNYGLKPHGDLTKIDISSIPNFDVLCAGFPCQPFSKAGNQHGFGDEKRGNIFFNICDIVEHHKPKYLILENVRNLASHDGGNTWNVIKTKIDELGYNTYPEPVILNTLYFGVPQSRERVVIMCKRKDLGDLKDLPSITKDNIKSTSLETVTILDSSTDYEKYKIKNKMIVTHNVWNTFLNLLKENNIEIPRFPLWTDWWDSDGEGTQVTKVNKKLSEDENNAIIKEKQEKFYKKYKNWIDKNRKFYEDNKTILEPWLIESRNKELWKGAVRKFEWQVKGDEKTMDEVLWSPRGSGVRVKSPTYTPTLVAMASMIPIYGPKKRQLTPRECARLQSFPEEYKIHPIDKIAYKQFGNAVNVTMIERCAEFLIRNKSLF